MYTHSNVFEFAEYLLWDEETTKCVVQKLEDTINVLNDMYVFQGELTQIGDALVLVMLSVVQMLHLMCALPDRETVVQSQHVHRKHAQTGEVA